LLEIFSADSRRLQAGAIETAAFPHAGVSIGCCRCCRFWPRSRSSARCNSSLPHRARARVPATADDLRCQLMGLDNRHIFGLAMALSLAVVAVAGVLLPCAPISIPPLGRRA